MTIMDAHAENWLKSFKDRFSLSEEESDYLTQEVLHAVDKISNDRYFAIKKKP